MKKKIHFSHNNEFLLIKNIFLIRNIVYSDRSELEIFDETIRINIVHFSRKL